MIFKRHLLSPPKTRQYTAALYRREVEIVEVYDSEEDNLPPVEIMGFIFL